VGVEIDAEAVPIYDETRQLCEVLMLDPLGLIASGALLLTVAPADAEAVCKALVTEGVPCAVIGRATEAGDVSLQTPDGSRPLPRYDSDELTRVL
jgi:hydrogenase maturation factor